jgi:hypothetical protein
MRRVKFEASTISESFVIARTQPFQSHRVVRGMIRVFIVSHKTICECHNHRKVRNYQRYSALDHPSFDGRLL